MIVAFVILNTCACLSVSSWSSLSVCIRKQLDCVYPLSKRSSGVKGWDSSTFISI